VQYRFRFLLAGLSTLLAVQGCDTTGAAPDRRTLIDSRDTEDPRSLDPALSTDVPTGRAVGYLFDGLTGFTPDARLEPRLAERWDVSEDGRTYTFHLRKGVTFHDGTPFTSRHVLASFQRVLDPATKGGRGWPLYPIEGAQDFAEGRGTAISGLSAPDDFTVVIRLREPLAVFTKMLAMPVAAIVPENVGQNFGQNPVGTGPWKLAEWRHDDYLLFARNDKYWGGPPPAESLMARIIPEPSTAVAEFESGNVDILVVPEGETRRWEETDEKRAALKSAPALILYHVSLNTTRGPLKDARVRRAINHAVDVEQILRSVMSGRGRRAAGVIPPTLEGADTTRQPYAHDVALAKKLLAEAGYPNGLDIELWHSSVATTSRLAQSIQGYLAEAGIRAKLMQRDAPSVREAARKGETDMLIRTWYADYPDAENFLFPLLHSSHKGVGGNYSFYTNPQLDQLVDRARRELNDAERARMYREADKIAYDDAPMLFLFFYNELYAVQPWISGFEVPTILNGQRWLKVRKADASTR
jgi:ABC-type transport system substrate-binding protein